MDGVHGIDAAALSKLRWRCRRGLLENDLLIERLFARGSVTPAAAAGLEALMPLADNDLLDLFSAARSRPVNSTGPRSRGAPGRPGAGTTPSLRST
jgi:antitoxin CptB